MPFPQVKNINLAEILLASEKIKAMRQQQDLLAQQMAAAPAQAQRQAEMDDLGRQLKEAQIAKTLQGTATAEGAAEREQALRNIGAGTHAVKSLQARPEYRGEIMTVLQNDNPEVAALLGDLDLADEASFGLVQQQLDARREALAPSAVNKDFELAGAAGVSETNAAKALWEKKIAKSGPLVDMRGAQFGPQSGNSEVEGKTKARAEETLERNTERRAIFQRIRNIATPEGADRPDFSPYVGIRGTIGRSVGGGKATAEGVISYLRDKPTSLMDPEERAAYQISTEIDSLVTKQQAAEKRALLGGAQTDSEIKGLGNSLLSTSLESDQFSIVLDIYERDLELTDQIAYELIGRGIQTTDPRYAQEMDRRFFSIRNQEGRAEQLAALGLGSRSGRKGPARKTTAPVYAESDPEGSDILDALGVE